MKSKTARSTPQSPSFAINEHHGIGDDGGTSSRKWGWWEVHKFGGTSLASADCYRLVSSIIEEQISNTDSSSSHQNYNYSNNDDDKRKHLAIVVSAMGATKPDIKTTDLLLSTVEHASNRNETSSNSTIQKILNKHDECLSKLELPLEEQERLKQMIRSDISDVQDILKTVSLLKWNANKISELVSGYGELWSAQILTSLLRYRALSSCDASASKSEPKSESETVGVRHGGPRRCRHEFVYIDARRVITIDEDAVDDGCGAVCWDISEQNMNEVIQEEMAKLSTVRTGEDGKQVLEHKDGKGDNEGNNRFSNAESSEKQQQERREEEEEEEVILHLVITGYVASNTQGVATTLQRDGSDYSASILGRLLHSTSITIWTDVNGVLSADPRRVPDAHVVSEVSYNEAMELAYFGAKVIHPKTMTPAILAQPSSIPIYIRNTFNSSHPGSRIYKLSSTHTERDKCVCGFSSVDGIALINVEGSGLIGVHGVAKRLFATLEHIGVNVVLISQASSEHSITFATIQNDAGKAKEALEETFAKELKADHISDISVVLPCSIIAAVGDGMATTCGVSGLFFTALGDAKINVIAISQGCSERNISAVVHTSDSSRALRAVHTAFRLSYTTVRIGIVGNSNNNDACGTMMSENKNQNGEDELGHSLLRLLERQREKIRHAFDVDLQVCAVLEVAADCFTGATEVTANDDWMVILDEVTCTRNSNECKEEGVGDSITTKAYNVAKVGSGLFGVSPSSAASSPKTTGGGSLTKAGENVELGMKTKSATDCTILDFSKHVIASGDCIGGDAQYSVIFDCTGSERVGKCHAQWLTEGVHIITANSTALSSSSREVRDELDRAENKKNKTSSATKTDEKPPHQNNTTRTKPITRGPGGKYLREVTVCGALPIISTLRDLLSSGDSIRRIDGIMSISMSYIFHRIAPPPLHHPPTIDGDDVFDDAAFDVNFTHGVFNPEQQSFDLADRVSFSEAVKEAMALGLTEKNPIQDLSNEITARCLLVLAKELGMDDEYDISKIQSLSDCLMDYDLLQEKKDDNLEKISAKLDERMEKVIMTASEQGCVPRHVSCIDVKTNQIQINIVNVPKTHMFAINPPGCEMVRFFTHRYKQYPLMVQGPAAGVDATSSALLAELLNLIRTTKTGGGRDGGVITSLSRTESSAYIEYK